MRAVTPATCSTRQSKKPSTRSALSEVQKSKVTPEESERYSSEHEDNVEENKGGIRKLNVMFTKVKSEMKKNKKTLDVK